MVVSTGSAVYVYGIMIAMRPSPFVSKTNLSFYIDNEPVGAFLHITPFSNSSIVYQYNALLYHNTSLSYSKHSIDLINGHGGTFSVVLLDYIIYSRSVYHYCAVHRSTTNLPITLTHSNSLITDPGPHPTDIPTSSNRTVSLVPLGGLSTAITLLC